MPDLLARKQRALWLSWSAWVLAFALAWTALAIAGVWFWPGLSLAAAAAGFALWQGIAWRDALVGLQGSLD